MVLFIKWKILRQGAKEKEKWFVINFLFEKSNTDVPRNQGWFMKGFILPFFEI